MGERHHITQENIGLDVAVDRRGVNVHFGAGGKYHCTNCDRGAVEFARSQRARDRRRRVAQGATAGFFAAALTGGGIGAGVGAIIGSIVPGPGTLLGAAVGAAIGGGIGGGTLGGVGVVTGATVAAATSRNN